MSDLSRSRLLLLIPALLLVIPTAACSSADNEVPSPEASDATETPLSSDDQEIRDVFNGYRAALLAGDGVAAFEALSQSTIDFYVEMRDLALTASKKDLQKRSLVDRLHALTLRYVLAPQRLEKMSPTEIVAYAVDTGLIGQGTLQLQELEDIKILGDIAEATVTSDGDKTQFTYEFVRDEGGWRLNLLVVLEVAEERFVGLIESEGITETALIFDTIEVITGQRPTNVIWNPPNPG